MRLFALLFAAWVPLAPVIVPRQEVAAVSANGKLYVIGGIGESRGALDSVEEYDPLTNRSRLIAPLPRARHHAAAAVVGNAIYVIGGFGAAFDAQSSVFRY